jgi:succinate dehydrogenase / fumarate reductase flavoprotein subunit
MVTRSIQTEINEGRGIEGKDYVHLDLTHLGREKLKERLPEITGFAKTYVGIDPAEKSIPIQPTAHYSMGGIPTTNYCEVVLDEKGTILPGFFAAGECACISVHGANRLGTNSLLDATLHGRRAGKQILKFLREAEFLPLPSDAGETDAGRFQQLFSSSNGTESYAKIKEELRENMSIKTGVFREEKGLKEMMVIIQNLKQKFQKVGLHDKSKNFNTELMEIIETGNLLDFSEVIVEGALARKECRGAHWRTDATGRDDKNWMKHTFAFKTDKGIELRYKPVTVTRYQPQERKY